MLLGPRIQDLDINRASQVFVFYDDMFYTRRTSHILPTRAVRYHDTLQRGKNASLHRAERECNSFAHTSSNQYAVHCEHLESYTARAAL